MISVVNIVFSDCAQDAYGAGSYGTRMYVCLDCYTHLTELLLAIYVSFSVKMRFNGRLALPQSFVDNCVNVG